MVVERAGAGSVSASAAAVPAEHDDGDGDPDEGNGGDASAQDCVAGSAHRPLILRCAIRCAISRLIRLKRRWLVAVHVYQRWFIGGRRDSDNAHRKYTPIAGRLIRTPVTGIRRGDGGAFAAPSP